VENSISIGDLAAFVTAVGIAVYVMGLVGLSVTIRFNFTRDFTTAWYAVSLLPRTVVAGQGVRLWLMWPIIVTVILLPTAQIANDTIFAIVHVATLLLAGASLSLTWPRFVRRTHREPATYLYLPAVLLASLGGGIIGYGARVAQNPASESILFGRALEGLGIAVDEYSFVIGILLMLLGGFAMGIPSAIVFRPPLPRVKLEIDDGTSNPPVVMKQGSNSFEGWLVAHSDGLWHLFLDESRELQSIPDENVRVARTGVEEYTPPPEEDAKPGAGKDG
jgi:hypothetical protein